MNETPLKAFIRSILFKKLSWWGVFNFFYWEIYLIFLISSPPKKVYLIGVVIFIGIYSVIAITNIFNCQYSFFKTYKYGRTKLPNDSEEFKLIPEFDNLSFLKNLEKRVEELEKNTPFKIGIYALFLSILIAIVLKFLK